MDNQMHALERKLESEDNNLHLHSIFHDKADQIDNLKSDEIMEKKTAWAIIRCHANWVECGDRGESRI